MKINILMGPFLPVPPIKGGAVEKIFFTLSREFAKLGHDVNVISRKFPGLPDYEINEGIRFIRIASFNTPKSKILYRILDIIYAVRAVRHLPAADITLTHSVFAPLLLPTKLTGKLVVSVARMPKKQMWLYRHASRLQAVSSAVEEAIIKQTPSAANIVKTIPNCLSHNFSTQSTSTRGNRTKEILYVGRIASEKGIHLLIKAFVDFGIARSGWRLKIVGPIAPAEGGDGDRYFTLLNRLALQESDYIDFVRPIYNETQLIEIYRQADIFVYPSLSTTGETFGLAPLEAMACGAAVIVSNLKCFGQFVRNEQNGLIFDHTDTSGNALGIAMTSLIKSDDLRSKLGSAAINTASEYLPSNISAKFIKDFYLLLGLGGSGSEYV